jgi:hypothetical protein
MHNSLPVLHISTCFSCRLFWVWKWWALPLRQLFLNFWILPVNWSLIWSVFYYLWKVFWFSFKHPVKVLAQYSGCSWRCRRETNFTALWCIAIISLIFKLHAHTQLNFFILFTKNLVHVSVLTAPFSGRTLTTSQNHLLIVRLLQWLSYRAWNISYVQFFQSCSQLLKQYWLVMV